MIIACPSCATRHQLPHDHISGDGSVIKCGSCGYSWIEGNAVIEGSAVEVECSDLSVAGDVPDTDHEAMRIAKAAQQAAIERECERNRKIKTRNGWMLLAACIALPLVVGIAIPDMITRIFPRAAKIYKLAGIKVNSYGFDITGVTHQYVLSDNVRVLAIRGNVVNVSAKAGKAPAIRFILKDKQGKQVYAWTLNGVSTRPVAAGASANFLTRVAAPPKNAENIEIRFARAKELRINAAHVGYYN